MTTQQNDLKFTSCGDYMKGETFLISDTHWGHINILKFTDSKGNLIRGDKFSTVQEMNDCMYDNWQLHVKENDTVYHLGDVAFGPYKQTDFAKKFRKLNGKKYLVVGNHDDIPWVVQEKLFDDVMMWRKLKSHRMLLTHTPIHQSSLKTYDDGTKMINVHGHIHQVPSPTKNHRCACVEWTDYAPIHIDDVLALNNYKTKVKETANV